MRLARFGPPVDGLLPDGGDRVQRPLVVERHVFLAALAQPDVAEVLKHGRQGRGRHERIDARAVAVCLRRADFAGDAADRLAAQFEPPVPEPPLDHGRLEDADQLTAPLGVGAPEAGDRLAQRFRPGKAGLKGQGRQRGGFGVELLGQRDEQVRLRVVVVVEGCRGPAGRLGDVADLGVEVTVAREHQPGGVLEGLIGGPSLAGRRGHETRLSRPAQYGSRSAARGTLPVALRGSSGTTVTPVGHLNPASRSRAQLSSSPVSKPGAATTTACTVSPHVSSGMPMTAMSATAGCWARTVSTSAGNTFSPPVITTSFSRSTIVM